MAERRVIKGWVYERGDDGQIRPVGPAGGGSAQPPADPTFQYKGEGAALDNASKRANIANDAQRIALERQRVALAQQAAGSAQSAAQRAAQIAERDRNAKIAPLNALNNQLHRTWDLYAKGPGATKGLSGLADYLPGALSEENGRFNTAGAGLAEIGLNAFRTPGVGSQSDKELKAFVEANRPSASDRDGQIEEKLGNLENRLREQYRAYGVPYQPYRPGQRAAPPRKQATARFLGWEK